MNLNDITLEDAVKAHYKRTLILNNIPTAKLKNSELQRTAKNLLGEPMDDLEQEVEEVEEVEEVVVIKPKAKAKSKAKPKVTQAESDNSEIESAQAALASALTLLTKSAPQITEARIIELIKEHSPAATPRKVVIHISGDDVEIIRHEVNE